MLPSACSDLTLIYRAPYSGRYCVLVMVVMAYADQPNYQKRYIILALFSTDAADTKRGVSTSVYSWFYGTTVLEIRRTVVSAPY